MHACTLETITCIKVRLATLICFVRHFLHNLSWGRKRTRGKIVPGVINGTHSLTSTFSNTTSYSSIKAEIPKTYPIWTGSNNQFNDAKKLGCQLNDTSSVSVIGLSWHFSLITLHCFSDPYLFYYFPILCRLQKVQKYIMPLLLPLVIVNKRDEKAMTNKRCTHTHIVVWIMHRFFWLLK